MSNKRLKIKYCLYRCLFWFTIFLIIKLRNMSKSSISIDLIMQPVSIILINKIIQSVNKLNKINNN
jgi:hypothetical protein